MRNVLNKAVTVILFIISDAGECCFIGSSVDYYFKG